MPNPNIYALTDTRWSNAGTTYNAIWMDLNNGAAGSAVGAAASRPLRLSNNGVNFFEVDLTGQTTIGGTTGVTVFSNGANALGFIAAGGGSQIYFDPQNRNFLSNGVMQINGGQTTGVGIQGVIGLSDVIITRDAANTLALQNSTNAQQFNVYNTFTDSSNYERGTIGWKSFVGNAFVIGTEALGTGTPRDIFLNTPSAINFRSGGNVIFQVTNSTFQAGTDNTYDIGASGSSRPRNFYQGGYHVLGVLTWGSISASVTPAEGIMIGCSTAVTVAAGVTVNASGTGHALLYYDGTQYKACS